MRSRRSYETFEKEASKHLAAPMLTEQKHKYQAAKTVFQERRRLQDGIKWDLLALPLAAKSAEMEKQVGPGPRRVAPTWRAPWGLAPSQGGDACTDKGAPAIRARGASPSLGATR